MLSRSSVTSIGWCCPLPMIFGNYGGCFTVTAIPAGARHRLVDRFHETNRFKLPGPHPEEAGEAQRSRTSRRMAACTAVASGHPSRRIAFAMLLRMRLGEDANMIRTSETLYYARGYGSRRSPGRRGADGASCWPTSRSLILRSRAHGARRLEGWMQCTDSRPSFETHRIRAAPLATTAKPLRGDEVFPVVRPLMGFRKRLDPSCIPYLI
jgi:hypothetical protein